MIEVVIDPAGGPRVYCGHDCGVAEAAGRLHLHLLARFVLGRARVGWTSRWCELTPWARLLCAARPELSEREAARRWLLAFDLILQTFGAPLADTPYTERVPVRTLRAFVTAGLVAP